MQGIDMFYTNDTDTSEATDLNGDHHLILDGTVHMDDIEDISLPRIKGLVELFGDYFGD